jgi:molecular chaperone GrpE
MSEREEPRTEPVDVQAEALEPAETREPSAAEHAEANAELERLRAEVARAREEAERHWQQFLHAAADLENYKKLASKLQHEAIERTRRGMLHLVLGVLDNLERAIRYAEQSADHEVVSGILEGLRMTHRSVLEQLELFGVRPMDASGARFDPALHEAAETVPAEEAGVEPGTVVEVLQQGYLIDGQVLRPARVRVAQGGQGT